LRIIGKIGTGVAVLGLVLSTVQPAAAAPSGEGRSRATTTVTLITGDRVTMHNNTPIAVRPAKGREKVTFSRFSDGTHNYVIPADARRLIATGRVDQRLFDVATLVEFGYDDAHRDTVPLIVTHPAGQAAPRIARTTHDLPSIDGVAMAADKTGAAWEALTDGTTTRTAAAGVSKVWLDGKRKSTLDRSAAQIGAPTAWAAGYTGAGVKVAVLDTGVDQTHPDLADREIAEQNFSDAPDNTDNVGHGTHVASIVAGTGAKSGGKYRGIASGASILDGKILGDSGFGMDSWIIAGMEWAAQQGADIANMSIGGTNSPDIDPIEAAVDSLSAQYGILFVIAAGNSGGDSYTIDSPGSADAALTVGAVDRDDSLAGFSSRGPADGATEIKPDITAPGVGIVAALHSAGTINAPVEPGYTDLSGTSMATPHVAGAAALLAQQHPDWTGQQLKSALSGSAKPTAGLTAFQQGAGRVDLTRAITESVVTEPANVHLGTAAWPHDDDQPVTKSITYRNLGVADVTLDLALTDATAPEGASADGVFSLSANQITVPAGGTATVDVTGDAGAGTADGLYSAAITATAGDSVTRTPVGIEREVESYNLTLNYLTDNGKPTSEYSTFLYGLDTGRFMFPYDEDGSLTVRLPKGRYILDHSVLTQGGEHNNAIVQPGLVLDRDRTFTIDPTITKPVSVTPPAEATLDLGDIGYQVATDDVAFSGGPIAFDLSAVSTALLGGSMPDATSIGWVNTQWAGADRSFYGLTWFLDAFPTGYARTVKQRELATVRSDLGGAGTGVPFNTPQPADGNAAVWSSGRELALPTTQTAYLTTEGGTRWQSSMWLVDAVSVLASFDGPPRTYRAGRTYQARFNHPVFGPAQPPADSPWSYRTGDTMLVNVPMYTDSGGNAGLSVETASTRLYAGDELVGESQWSGFAVAENLPAGRRDYRVVTEATRPAPFDLTTAVSAEWTFRSSHVDGTVALPLHTVRFAPRLAADGSAPAGRTFVVPVQVLDEHGAAERPRRLSVEVSYDEGRTWQRAPVSHDQKVTLKHPAGATSVSLRASATDRDGTTVKQTVVRAYKLR
jgi:subtilisin family serine protease